jgi:hypothetical protein
MHTDFAKKSGGKDKKTVARISKQLKMCAPIYSLFPFHNLSFLPDINDEKAVRAVLEGRKGVYP